MGSHSCYEKYPVPKRKTFQNPMSIPVVIGSKI